MRIWFYRNREKALKYARKKNGKLMEDHQFGYYVYIPDEDVGKILPTPKPGVKINEK